MNKKGELIGRTYPTNKWGGLVVIDYINAHKVLVEFVDTKYKKWTSMGRVRSGGVRDNYRPTVHGVGFLGEGAYSTGGRKRNATYTMWYNMMNRCYSEAYQKKNPSYKGCSVAKEWHNYQVFAKWVEDNGGAEGQHLDKDIKVKGNRIYSPEYCMIISPRENIQYTNNAPYDFISPDNVIHVGTGIATFAKSQGLDPSALSKVLRGEYKQHKGWTKYV